MKTRRSVLGLLAAISIAFTVPAAAADRLPFDMGAFQSARAAGLPVLVDISAPWCSTCKVQTEIVSQLVRSPKFDALVIFEVDYDTQKDIMRSLGAQFRSTLIAYRGEAEVGRIVGDTRWTAIEALLASAI